MLDITKRMDLLRMSVEELRDILNDILRKDPNASISFSDSYMGGGELHYDTKRESYFFSNEDMSARYREDIYYDSFDLFKNYDEAKRNHIIDCIIDQYPEELVSKYTPSFEEAKPFAKYFNEEDFNNALYNIALANLFGENRDTFNILQRYGYGFEQRLIASEAFKEYVANGKEYWENITEEEIEKRVAKVQKEYDESWDKAFNKKKDEVVEVNMMQGFNEKDICTLCKAITTLDEKYINFVTDYLKLKPMTKEEKLNQIRQNQIERIKEAGAIYYTLEPRNMYNKDLELVGSWSGISTKVLEEAGCNQRISKKETAGEKFILDMHKTEELKDGWFLIKDELPKEALVSAANSVSKGKRK